jgi:hypothetical protein
MKYLIAFLLAALSVGAQTANVIELKPADTAQAQKAWDALQKAQREWENVQETIGSKYVYTGPVWAIGGTGMKEIHQPVAGFDGGFEFSKDFKYIVPKLPEQKPYPYGQWGGVVGTPYIGDCSKGPC